MVIHIRIFLLLCWGYVLFLGADQPGNTYTIQTVAGNDSVGDGGAALEALFSQTEGIAVDRQGNIYVADADNNRVRKMASDGTIDTVAGTGVSGFAGDGGPAKAALLSHPYGLALDAGGNLYIADLGNARIRKVTTDGNIRTVAGGGSRPPSAPPSTAAAGGPALNAQFTAPRNITLDPDGTLYISDFGANFVYRVSPAGILTTLAGTGTAGYSGDDSSANLAQLSSPAGLASDSFGSVYIADSGNNCIRRVFRGVISTVFSVTEPTGVAVDPGGSLYIAASNYLGTLYSAFNGVATALDVAVDGSGNVYATGGQFVVEVTNTGSVNMIAGSGLGLYFSGDGGLASGARLHTPSGMALDSQGNIYIADTANNRIRQIAAGAAIITIAGTGNASAAGDDGPATNADLNSPEGVAIDSQGNLYIADTGNNKIRKVTPAGSISTVVDGLNSPQCVATGVGGSIYIADTGNDRVLQVTASGNTSTLAPALKPAALMVDGEGNILVSELTRVSKITPAGVASTVVDGLKSPRGLAFTADGTLLIAETGTNLIRSFSSRAGLATIAGTGTPGFSGDGGPAAAAQLNAPADLAVDSNGIIWIADAANNRIRTLTPPSTAPAQQTTDPTVVNGASLTPGNVAPGEIITIFGSGFDPKQTQLLFDGNPATTFYIGPGQINAMAPANLAPNSTTQISITVAGASVAALPSNVVGAMPGIFTVADGVGQAAATNQDGTVNSASNPAARGSIIVLYATGQGNDLSSVSLTIGGYSAALRYAGPAPGFHGLLQINAEIPAGFLVPGILPVILSVGNASSQDGVTIAVQ